MPSLFLRPVMPSGAEGVALQLDWLLLQKDTVIDRGRAALHELSQLGAQSSWGSTSRASPGPTPAL